MVDAGVIHWLDLLHNDLKTSYRIAKKPGQLLFLCGQANRESCAGRLGIFDFYGAAMGFNDLL